MTFTHFSIIYMRRRFNCLSLLFLTVTILFASCKDNEDINVEIVTESSQYILYQDGNEDDTMISLSLMPWPTPEYALNVPADGATFRLDDVVNWMTDIELTPPKGENNDYISIIPHYVNDNGKERIDYFDITFKPNETGKQRECVIRTLPYEAIEIGNEMIFVGTAFRVYQGSM